MNHKGDMPIADTVRLNSGFEMPVVAFGTWQIPRSIAAERVREALEAGYRHIDCALSFKNQPEIGAGIQEWCKIRKVRREELFLSSKIWNTFHSRAKCMEQVDMMLEDFNTRYMDLVVIHWPFGWAEDEPGERGMWPRGNDGKFRKSEIDFLETWTALEDIHRTGKIRAIGLANFSLEQVDRIYTKGLIKPCVLQVEMNPYFSQIPMRKYCKERGIILVAHMVTGNPSSAFYRKHEDPNLLHNETICSIGRLCGKTTTQILLRWVIDSGHCAIIKSVEPKRIRQNLNIFKFYLIPEYMERIDALNMNFRILNPILGNEDHPYYPWPYRPVKTEAE
uniref:Aldo_ket_red domain-containing protein n=1 Tax=Caenorhabditis tropicalis TaxID=1561998 RepID=A0A1I7UUI7_9PELO